MVERLTPSIPLTPIVTYYRGLPTGRAKRLKLAEAGIRYSNLVTQAHYVATRYRAR